MLYIPWLDGTLRKKPFHISMFAILLFSRELIIRHFVI
jgi:hypothetical protein